MPPRAPISPNPRSPVSPLDRPNGYLVAHLGVQPTAGIAAILRRGEAAVGTRVRKLGMRVGLAQGWPLLRRSVTLHDHDGHDVTIGHPGDDFDGLETVIWCDTCQQLISSEATGSACHSDHFMAPYRYQHRPQEPANS